MRRKKIDKLPFIISVPHGGDKCPEELKNNSCITPRDLFDDSDSFTQEIYNLKDFVKYYITTDIARAFVDQSRSEDQLPPKYIDGLIKSKTCYGKPIYHPKHFPDIELQQLLINKYYHPYHKKIEQNLESSKLILGLDCHSMADIAPLISPDIGSKRPLINLGDNSGQSCPGEVTTLLKESFMEVFHFNDKDITINSPFKGGYITRKYGNNPIPWIQIELNRKLYLSPQWFSYKTLKVDPRRIKYLNDNIRKVFYSFFTKLENLQTH